MDIETATRLEVGTPATKDPIPLRLLLPGIDPSEYKLHCAVWNGQDHPLDVFDRSWDEWLTWNTWRGSRNDFNRRYVFSVAQVPDEPDCWIFGGVFEVMSTTSAPYSHAYEIEFRDQLLPGCVGRLKIRYRPAGRHLRGLNFETALEQIQVAEILKLRHAGAPFPGHDRLHHSLRELEVVYAQQRSDWRGALECMKGVYVIHDRASGKRYIGSACADTGIWARWGQYVETQHGGNVDLRALVDEKGVEYARSNLTFALLEFWSMRTPDDHVIARESYWKEVLLTRRYGHNRN